MKSLIAALAAAMILTPAATQAALYDVSYSGKIDTIDIPAGAEGLAVGDPVNISFRYDSKDLVDISNAPGLLNAGISSVPGLYAVTLANSYDSLNVTLGGQTFHASDDYEFGTNAGLDGFPAFPQAYFLNDKLLGIDFEGDYDDADPTDFAFVALENLTEPDLAPAPLFGAYYPNAPDFSVYETSFTGSFDVADASITAVAPEPSSWGLMILGVGAMGSLLRRRRYEPAQVAL